MMNAIRAVAFSCAVAMPAAAEVRPAEVEELFALLGQDQIVEVMRQESFAYGENIAEMFFGAGDAAWDAQLEAIYRADWMREQLISGFARELDGEDIGAITAYFETDPGARIVELEVAARTAMLDDAVSDAAKASGAEALADPSAKMRLIQEFVDVNDLIEMNVVGGMNGNYAFFMGLLDNGAFEGQTTADTLLSDVANQEAEIRASTTEWIYGFLNLAYSPLSEADLENYIAFSRTEAGRALNKALFVAYDDLFNALNRAVGAAAAARMKQSEL